MAKERESHEQAQTSIVKTKENLEREKEELHKELDLLKSRRSEPAVGVVLSPVTDDSSRSIVATEAATTQAASSEPHIVTKEILVGMCCLCFYICTFYQTR